jgi:hypothetical protein
MIAPHETVLPQMALHEAPHEVVQSVMSWQSKLQRSSQTPPQRIWFSHVSPQPEPLHDR